MESSQSGVEDEGVRASASGSATGGAVLVEYGSTVDISLVGSISYVPTGLGSRQAAMKSFRSWVEPRAPQGAMTLLASSYPTIGGPIK